MDDGSFLATRSFLAEASLRYKDVCPELSRTLMLRQKLTGPSATFCAFCFQWREPENHHVRLNPKRKPSARLQRLLRKEAKGHRLNLQQKDRIRRFRNSSSTLMATCHTCNKMTRSSGVNRNFLISLGTSPITPRGSAKHKSPRSANKSNTVTPKSRAKTPASTPRSGSSGTTSASKSSSVKKSPFSRLKKMLMLEDSPTGKKGTLKDFFCSL
ncbi:UPF0711 protein C18orf21 homolog [Denticeps clupeoides]|uniref:Uncharacterized protein n=1 Tax=Denticeps clupeoides TaxID=299321 RepID=A0AAY4ENM6_9TELE|nr:UPF0711 protein C18orf21 homolog [Denticeps clupeoides]